MAKILVTGAAGFIGYHVSRLLLERGDKVVGMDCLSDYYDVSLKQARVDQLTPLAGFRFVRQDLADRPAVAALFGDEGFHGVVHLAAQAGVRYSTENPAAYIDSNLVGFANVLEGCRQTGVRHLVFASSSSVYGASTKMPYSTHDPVGHPLSLYGATKRCDELLAHSYSVMFGLPATGLRFFTVYGPWGRPDMVMFKFTKAILAGEPIEMYHHGQAQRDFTYVDDVAEGVVRSLDRPAAPAPGWSAEQPDPATSPAPFRVYNLGNNQPVGLMQLVDTMEQCLGRKADRRLVPLPPADLPATWADITDFQRDIGFTPRTSIEEGVKRLVEWYRGYYAV
ncbi:MAG: NAD-dependent epimerase [Pirellulales bacterium]